MKSIFDKSQQRQYMQAHEAVYCCRLFSGSLTTAPIYCYLVGPMDLSTSHYVTKLVGCSQTNPEQILLPERQILDVHCQCSGEIANEGK